MQIKLTSVMVDDQAFAAGDIHREFERMKKLGVVFKTEPTKMGPVTVAVFEDTCGNLIQLYQE